CLHHRQWPRHPGQPPVAGVRAVLHDQARRRGHRAGTRHRPAHRHRTSRGHRARVGARPNDVPRDRAVRLAEPLAGRWAGGYRRRRGHGMRLENTFDVPAPPERAWELLMDVPRVIPCMPGAELTETVDDATWKAT